MQKESIKSITDIKKLADADIPISQKKFFRLKNGAEYYEMSRPKLTALARECGALFKIDGMVFIERETFEFYLESFRMPGNILR